MQPENKCILPWQKTIWDSLLQRTRNNRLPHALLFSGIDGIGKKEFAQHFSNYLLCHSPDENGACGHCRSCHFIQANSHPDMMWVEPEEGAQLIKIDQIREIVNFVNGTAMLNGYRVIIINPASAMNMNAANALLKTLEEPTANTLLILICNQSLRLPATISSRCQKIIFQTPAHDVALEWLSSVSDGNLEKQSLALNLAQGAPLLARDFIIEDVVTLRRDLYDGLVQMSAQQMDPLSFATKWDDKDVKMLISLLMTWLQDLLRFKLAESQAMLINADYQTAIGKITAKLTSESILQYSDVIQKIYTQMSSSLNMNRQLLLNEIFIRWVKLC